MIIFTIIIVKLERLCVEDVLLDGVSEPNLLRLQSSIKMVRKTAIMMMMMMMMMAVVSIIHKRGHALGVALQQIGQRRIIVAPVP